MLQAKVYKSRLLQWWNTLCMGPKKCQRTYKQMQLVLEADSWLCNFVFSYFQQTKKRLNLKTQFKIQILLSFTSSRKVLEKMPEAVY